jgi:hypothetical protein
MKCTVCNSNPYDSETGVCEQCAIDSARDYRVRSLGGRCRSGGDSAGTRFHAVKLDWSRALCGSKPGYSSYGWSEWGKEEPVNCPRCLKRLIQAEQVEQAIDSILPQSADRKEE